MPHDSKNTSKHGKGEAVPKNVKSAAVGCGQKVAGFAFAPQTSTATRSPGSGA